MFRLEIQERRRTHYKALQCALMSYVIAVGVIAHAEAQVPLITVERVAPKSAQVAEAAAHRSLQASTRIKHFPKKKLVLKITPRVLQRALRIVAVETTAGWSPLLKLPILLKQTGPQMRPLRWTLLSTKANEFPSGMLTIKLSEVIPHQPDRPLPDILVTLPAGEVVVAPAEANTPVLPTLAQTPLLEITTYALETNVLAAEQAFLEVSLTNHSHIAQSVVLEGAVLERVFSFKNVPVFPILLAPQQVLKWECVLSKEGQEKIMTEKSVEGKLWVRSSLQSDKQTFSEQTAVLAMRLHVEPHVYPVTAKPSVALLQINTTLATIRRVDESAVIEVSVHNPHEKAMVVQSATTQKGVAFVQLPLFPLTVSPKQTLSWKIRLEHATLVEVEKERTWLGHLQVRERFQEEENTTTESAVPLSAAWVGQLSCTVEESRWWLFIAMPLQQQIQQRLFCTNIGGLPLSLTEITVTGPHAPSFSGSPEPNFPDPLAQRSPEMSFPLTLNAREYRRWIFSFHVPNATEKFGSFYKAQLLIKTSQGNYTIPLLGFRSVSKDLLLKNRFWEKDNLTDVLISTQRPLSFLVPESYTREEMVAYRTEEEESSTPLTVAPKPKNFRNLSVDLKEERYSPGVWRVTLSTEDSLNFLANNEQSFYEFNSARRPLVVAAPVQNVRAFLKWQNGGGAFLTGPLPLPQTSSFLPWYTPATFGMISLELGMRIRLRSYPHNHVFLHAAYGLSYSGWKGYNQVTHSLSVGPAYCHSMKVRTHLVCVGAETRLLVLSPIDSALNALYEPTHWVMGGFSVPTSVQLTNRLHWVFEPVVTVSVQKLLGFVGLTGLKWDL